MTARQPQLIRAALLCTKVMEDRAASSLFTALASNVSAGSSRESECLQRGLDENRAHFTVVAHVRCRRTGAAARPQCQCGFARSLQPETGGSGSRGESPEPESCGCRIHRLPDGCQ